MDLVKEIKKRGYFHKPNLTQVSENVAVCSNGERYDIFIYWKDDGCIRTHSIIKKDLQWIELFESKN